MECEYCKNSFETKYSLKNHQKRSKYCINIQQAIVGPIVSDLVSSLSDSPILKE